MSGLAIFFLSKQIFITLFKLLEIIERLKINKNKNRISYFYQNIFQIDKMCMCKKQITKQSK